MVKKDSLKIIRKPFKMSKIYQTNQQIVWQMLALFITYEYLLYLVNKLSALEFLKTAKQKTNLSHYQL